MNKIISALNKNEKELDKLKKVSSDILKNTFLSNQIHTIWMNNQIRRTIYKPDNKVLMGNVENTLNPVMDSSFSFSSARGTIEDKKIIIRPNSSKFFLKQSKSIKDLKLLFDNILDYIEANKDNVFKFKFLLDNIEDKDFRKDFDVLEDFTLKSPDWLDSLGLFNESTSLRKEEYEIIYDNLRFNIIPIEKEPDDFDYFYFASLKVVYNHISFKINFYQIHKAIYKSIFSDFVNDKEELYNEYLLVQEILQSAEFMKFYFSCGHIIDGDEVYKNKYNNIDYDTKKIKEIDFSKFDIKKEKPTIKNSKNNDVFDKTQIGKSDSLFCWSIHNWNQKIIDDNGEIKNEYMICDDGSNEIADFIHLVELSDNKYILNFIHVKASKAEAGKQRISVGAFDLVLTQAIKNARYTDINQLFEQLNNNSKSIDYLWKNNILSNKLGRKDFINKIDNIINNNYFYEANIIVVQPHLIKKKYKDSGNTNNKKLLNTLLHAANSAISGFSSSLYIICSE